jgi:hypothetical protein
LVLFQDAKVAQIFEKLHIFGKKVQKLTVFVLREGGNRGEINKRMLNPKKSGGKWWIVGENVYLCR